MACAQNPTDRRPAAPANHRPAGRQGPTPAAARTCAPSASAPPGSTLQDTRRQSIFFEYTLEAGHFDGAMPSYCVLFNYGS